MGKVVSCVGMMMLVLDMFANTTRTFTSDASVGFGVLGMVLLIGGIALHVAEIS
jgi:hypothetical protein